MAVFERIILTVVTILAASFWVLFSVAMMSMGDTARSGKQAFALDNLIVTLFVVSGVLWLVWRKWR